MEEQRNEGDNPCTHSAEEEVQLEGALGGWDLIEGEVDPAEINEIVWKEAGNGVGECSIPGVPRTSDQVDGPTGSVVSEGVETNYVADTVADWEEGGDVDPHMFWLLLEQAGYELR